MKNAADISQEILNLQLLQACSLEDTRQVEGLLAEGADPNVKVKEELLLHAVSKRGNVVIAELLLEHGATIDAQYQDEQTALHLASICGHLSMVKMLLESGANVNARTYYGDTPLATALESGEENIIRSILCYGGSIYSENPVESKKIWLEYLSKYKVLWREVRSLTSCYEALSGTHSSIDKRDDNGNTLLHAACERGDITLMTKLLEKPDLEKYAKNKSKRTPLHLLDKFLRDNKSREAEFLQVRELLIHPSEKRKAPELMNPRFIKKYFSAVMPASVAINTFVKDDGHILLTLERKENHESNTSLEAEEDLTFIQEVFFQEAHHTFSAKREDVGVSISSECKVPESKESQVPYTSLLALRKRYSPAIVSVKFESDNTYIEISLKNCNLPMTAEGKNLWLEAIEGELAALESKFTKVIKENDCCRFPMDKELEGFEKLCKKPWTVSLLETLCKRYVEGIKVSINKRTKAFVLLSKESSYHLSRDISSHRETPMSLSGEDTAFFMQQMLRSDNIVLKESQNKKRIGLFSEAFTAENLLNFQSSAPRVDVNHLGSLMRKMQEYYSLTEIKLCWNKENKTMGMLLSSENKNVDFMQWHLKQECGCTVEMLSDGQLKLQTFPKLSAFKKGIPQLNKQFTQYKKDEEERLRRREKQEREEKLTQQSSSQEQKSSSSERPAMKLVTHVLVKSSASSKQSGIQELLGKQKEEKTSSGTGNMKPVPAITVETIQKQLRTIQEEYANYHNRISGVDRSFELQQHRIYFGLYLRLFRLLTDWHQYLQRQEWKHEKNQTQILFDGKSEEMMVLRSCLSYSVAKDTMLVTIHHMGEYLSKIKLDGSAGKVLPTLLLPVMKEQEKLTPQSKVKMIRTCMESLNGLLIFGKTQDVLAKHLRENSKDFYFAKSLMVACAQLYREIPQEVKYEKKLHRFKWLLRYDLKARRNNVNNAHPEHYSEKKIANLILAIHQASVSAVVKEGNRKKVSQDYGLGESSSSGSRPRDVPRPSGL